MSSFGKMDTSANQSGGMVDPMANQVPGNHSKNTSGLILSGGTLYEDTATTVINNIVLPMVCAFGILGIILTVIVLSRKNMSTSTNCYLMGLAIADLMFLLLFAVVLGMSQITSSHQVYYFMSSIYPTYASIFMNMFLLASIWLTVMLAVERDIAISRPFLANKICTVNHARIIIVVIFIFAFACRMANFWENKLVSAFNPHTNVSVVYMEGTELAYNEHYNMIYPWLVDGFIASIIPFILLLGLNTHLIWEVRKSTRYMERNLTYGGAAHNVQREELQITIMLISVIIVFFICQAPYVIYTAMASINAFQTSVAILRFRYIAMLLLTLKSAINFILYCWFSEKFRASLKQVFCVHQCITAIRGKQNGPTNYYSLRRYSNCTRDTTVVRPDSGSQ